VAQPPHVCSPQICAAAVDCPSATAKGPIFHKGCCERYHPVMESPAARCALARAQAFRRTSPGYSLASPAGLGLRPSCFLCPRAHPPARAARGGGPAPHPALISGPRRRLHRRQVPVPSSPLTPKSATSEARRNLDGDSSRAHTPNRPGTCPASGRFDKKHVVRARGVDCPGSKHEGVDCP
jgi:hypothetical protein